MTTASLVKPGRLLEAQQPVVLFGGALGDHLMILPALRALARLFPQRLSWLGFPAALQDFYGDVPFAATYTDCMQVVEGRVVLDPVKAEVCLHNNDLLISLSTWRSPEIESLLAALPRAASLGYYPPFQNAIGLNNEVHMFEVAFDLVLQIDPTLCLEDFAQPPLLKEAYRRPARQLRQKLPAESKVLVVHADTKPEKMWETARLVATLDLFLEKHPEYVVWVVGTNDLHLNQGKQGGRVYRYLRLPLAVALALVSEADLFLGVDSCMLHAADLFRVPGVALFGPTSPAEWGFRFARHLHLAGQGSLAALTVSEVVEALETLARETGKLPSEFDINHKKM
jgi:ADP-heptose:LPS heptosyltransferase